MSVLLVRLNKGCGVSDSLRQPTHSFSAMSVWNSDTKPRRDALFTAGHLPVNNYPTMAFTVP